MDEMITLLHNYMISLRVWSSRENAQAILICAMGLLKEAGWKSPEECQAEFMIELEAWVREKNREGYMSPEMVKGLIFEVQAKKCAKCPKKSPEEVKQLADEGFKDGVIETWGIINKEPQ